MSIGAPPPHTNGSPCRPGQPGELQSEPASPLTIPDYQLLRCIGRGSYGEVWLARNLTGSYRAVKIIYRSSFKDEKPFEREFAGISKFEPISRSHEGFVEVLHVGRDEARTFLYYVMELADDVASGQQIDPETYAPKSLATEVQRAGKLSLQDSLRIGLALTQTLTELHGRGLVHRDIKPSNIIFVHGTPKLADIGLVTEALNAARTWVGTAGFIPPEGPGTKQADIYSLGKVLYEVSTGKDRQDFPALPTLLDVSPEHEGLLELNEVLVRACHHDPAKRYVSAWEMHAELTAVVNGKSVRRLRLLERRWARVKRGFTVAGGLVVVAGVLLFTGYREWQTRLYRHQQEVGANVAYGNNTMETGDLLGALPHFAQVLRLETGTPSERADRLRFGAVLAQCPKITRFWRGDKQAHTGVFSPDGSRVLVAEHFGTARIYDVRTGQLCGRPFGPRQGLSSAAYSPNGQLIVTASEDSTASIWDAAGLTELRHLTHPDRVFSARFIRDGQQVITCCRDGKARLWDTNSGELKAVFDAQAPVAFAAVSPNSDLLVTCGRDGTARLFDFPSGKLKGPPLKHGIWVTCACFSPDGTKVLTAADDRRVRVWDVATGERLLPDLAHKDVVTSVNYSPDGSLVATASLDGTVRLWSARNLQPLETNPLLRQGERVSDACFSPDARCLLVSCADGSVRLWDLSAATVPVASSPDQYCRNGARYIRAATNSFEVYDAASGNKLCGPILLRTPGVAELTKDGGYAFCISPASTAAGTNFLVQVWEARTGRLIAGDLSLPAAFNQAVLSDDGKLLAAYGGRAAQVWEVATKRAVTPLFEHESAITSAVFSKNHRVLLISSGNEVHAWNCEKAAPLFPPLAHATAVKHVEFSPDGALIVSCCSDTQLTECYAQIWNARTGLAVGPRLMHGDGVLDCSFSPDSKRVVTASQDSTAVVWETATGKRLGPPLKHEGQVLTARFSPDGEWIVTSSHDKTARVWSAQTLDPLTPPLRHLRRLFGATFLPGAKGVVTTDTRQSWVWIFPFENRSAGDVLDLAQFLSSDWSGGQAARSNRLPRLSSTPGHEQLARWHEFKAQQFESEEDWAGAAFHLKVLHRLHPNQDAIARRITRVEHNAR